MTDRWGRQITESDEAAPGVRHGVANGRTDLLKVGLVSLRRVMLMDTELVR